MAQTGDLATRPTQHLPPESLQAYAVGEVDPATRAAFEAHLGGCRACRLALGRVERVVEVFPGRSPVDGLDELAWRRIRQRVRTQLEDDAARGHGTLDLFMGRRWVPAGLAAAAAVAVLVWFAPRHRAPAPAPAHLPELAVAAAPPPAPDPVRRVLTEDSPATLTLDSGVELGLEVRSELLISEEGLSLNAGRLSYRDPRPLSPDAPAVKIRVGPHVLLARGAALDVERLGAQADVFVHAGQVMAQVDGGALDAVAPGEVQTLGAAPARPPQARVTRPRPTVAAPGAPKVAQAPAAHTTPLAPEETRVEVELPSDPVRRAWIAARAAYYEDGDLDRAIELAVRLRADAAGRVESRWAGSLLCEAYTARGRAREAVEVCTEVLPARQGEEARILHRRIAELYRGQLGDCARALPHYNQVLVFGRSSPLDEGARLARAECAAETGDWDLVRRDLLQLENSQIAKSTSPTGDPTEQRAALERIRQRLAQHRAAQAASGMADSE